MTRTAHYVTSTHWDREWYEPLQGFRMRLVSMLDEVFDTMKKDPAFKTFVMDGQVIPIHDYLEIHPEKAGEIRDFVKAGRFKLGPWYVLPDEWLVSGESIVRNLQMGMKWADEFGAPKLAAQGFVCDQFGHIGQLPQIFSQMGIPVAYVWRGTTEKDHRGHFHWQSPDGTSVLTYRFGPVGYCTVAFRVRESHQIDKKFDVDESAQKLVEYTLYEADRSPASAILLFDGGDHLEIEPKIIQTIAKANEKLAEHNIRIVHSDLDAYQNDLLKDAKRIEKKLIGELRETGREPAAEDEQWLIPGVYSSRIHLKQRNAACEDELCLWAEPFSAFASESLGAEYPSGFLRVAWKHLLDNHPHDSMCGCSPDQVHQDMIYRFDQSLGISSRLTSGALRLITSQAVGFSPRSEGSVVLGIFNSTSEAIDAPLDLDIPLPTKWPKKFNEFFGFEEKFSFKLRSATGDEIPYQLVSQRRDQMRPRRPRYKFPTGDPRHIIGVTAKVKVPAFGYTTIIVEPVDGPTRYLGTMATSHRSIENEHLRVSVNDNGTIDVTVKKTGQTFSQLLTFEQRADIGDGWYHGVAVNDQIFTSSACHADIALVTDGMNKATLRIAVTMNVPEAFDFKSMTRSTQVAPLKIVSAVTLRQGADHVEVTTTVHNTVLDHRVRVLLPTGLTGETYLSDSAFDIVERKVSLAKDNAIRKELDVETRPQITWTAFGDGKTGLAIVSRGLPETAIIDQPLRTIALTLLRAFRRAVFVNENMGGQIQGTHVFRYDIVPFSGQTPVKRLCLQGQRVNSPVRQIDLLEADFAEAGKLKELPREQSFLNVEGDFVVTSVQRDDGKLLVRGFNPTTKSTKVKINRAAKCVTLEGKSDDAIKSLAIPAKRIVTMQLD